MQGAAFIESIQTASAQNLKQAYVLMAKTTMTKMMSGKLMETKDTLLRKVKFDYFQSFIDQEVRRIHDDNDELVFNILVLYAQKYQLSLASIDTQQGLHEFGDKILDKAVQSYRSMNKKFSGTTFEEVVRDFFRKIFEEIGEKYNEGSPQEREALAKAFETFMADLPEYQQEKLKRELNVDDLSQKVITNVLTTNGTVILFTALVNTMGFSFYMGATSLLASSAGLLGITVPFGVYTFTTSSIAVLTGPIIFAGAIVFSGFYFKKQRSKALDMMTFLSVMQLFFSGGEEDGCSFESIRDRWVATSAMYATTLHSKNHQIDQEQTLSNKFANNRQDKFALEQTINQAIVVIETIQFDIKQDLRYRDLRMLEKYESLLVNIHIIYEVDKEIQKLSRKEIVGNGFFVKVRAAFENSKKLASLRDKESEKDQMLNDIVRKIISYDLPLYEKERETIVSKEEELHKYNRELASIDQQNEKLQKMLKELTDKRNFLDTELTSLKKEYPGIEHSVYEGGDLRVLYS
ncbi:hypothetical protein [Salicibibacter kimchii]|uniref:Uncharacterized protein n=1 Tax=Salicibibacter kimchii TaxID=2099786 RepID=A0A345C295_9BACI|nr:hypothetical protein [Salicibibacter kimchii]AXF57326.1 hypothetical protein DT065_15840 [Salicibibacter kimchii]